MCTWDYRLTYMCVCVIVMYTYVRVCDTCTCHLCMIVNIIQIQPRHTFVCIYFGFYSNHNVVQPITMSHHGLLAWQPLQVAKIWERQSGHTALGSPYTYKYGESVKIESARELHAHIHVDVIIQFMSSSCCQLKPQVT